MSEDHAPLTDTMSGADALLWTIGRDPVLRPTVVAVMSLDRAPRWRQAQQRVEALTTMVPRLRSRVVERPLGSGRPQFVPDDDFDLGLHLTRRALPAGGTFRDVLDLAQHMATLGFDPALPLWEAVVIEGVGDHGAVIVKVHHALVDGVGGLAVLANLLDLHRRASGPTGPTGSTGRTGRPRPAPPAPTPARPSGPLALPGQWVSAAAAAVTHPAEQFRRLVDTGTSVARLLAPAGQPMSPLMTGRSFRRGFDVLDFPLAQFHGAARATGGTLNDVFLTAIVRGLGRYHRRHGVAVSGLRALMPVNVRSRGDGAAGNHFVPARFVIPMGDDAAGCATEVRRITGAWKHAPGLALSDVLATGLSTLPPPVATAMWGSMLKGDDFCATNVPGSPVEVYFAGARVEGMYAFAPTSGAALNVALVSSAGRVTVGITLDTSAIPDGAVLTTCLQRGFDDVFALAGAAPAAAGAGAGAT